MEKPKSAFVTFDDIKLEKGTKIFHHEIQALKQATDLRRVVAQGYTVGDTSFRKLEFTKWYQFNPFLADYFAAQLVADCHGVDLLHMGCSPGLALWSTVRPKKYTVHIQAHDLKESIAEHEKIYGAGSYGLVHNTEPYLHALLLLHLVGADAVITASTPSARWIRNATRAKNVVVIPHGTNIPPSVAPLPSIFRTGYMGAWGPDKGLIYLMFAWKYFQGNGNLVFAGSHCDTIKQVAAQIDPSLREHEYLGFVQSVSDFYNYISVYVQPSVTEGFGFEVPEAMAHGRPVIVTSTTGAADLVDDGVDGFIVPPREPKAILEKMLFFHDNPEKIVEMGARAREKATNYSWEIIEQRYVELFREVLK